MPGDVVRRFIEGEDSQRGYVRRTSVMCHVQVLGKNKVIRNISSEELEPLRVRLSLTVVIVEALMCFCSYFSNLPLSISQQWATWTPLGTVLVYVVNGEATFGKDF